MRILLTGVTGGMGRAVAQGLLAAGHEVIGLAGRRGADLDYRVLYEAIADADVVLCLPTDPATARQSDVVRVCDAAARGGVRVIFPSFSLLEPRGWRQAEQLVATSWAPYLIVRMAAPVGRQVDAAVCRTVATLLSAAPSESASGDVLRVLHIDDLIRFLVVAVDNPHTGVVDLGTAGMCAIAQARRVLGGVNPRPKARGIGQWAQLATTDMDLEKVHDLWGFECGWGAADALADTVRGLHGRRLGVDGAIAVPGQFPLPVHTVNNVPEGEFDDRISPKFPIFVAASFNQEQSAPLMPMSLDLHLSGLRIAGRRLAELLGLPHSVAAEWENRLVGAFGQRIYFGASAVMAAQSQISRRGVDLVGRLRSVIPADVEIMLRPARAGSVFRQPALSAARLHSTVRIFGHQVQAYTYAASRERLDDESLHALRDAQLNVRIRLLRNRIYEGWTLWLASLLLADRHPAPQDGRISAEITVLATVMRAHPYIGTMIATDSEVGDASAARTAAPMFAAALDRTIAQVGHRGPGEMDLAASVFADYPEIVVNAAREAMSGPASVSDQSADALALAWDATMMCTHQLRLAVREWARRLVMAGQLRATDDIFYLTTEEALVMPVDAELRITRRVGERKRLRGVRPPAVIEGEWVPLADPGTAGIGAELRGRPGSPGSIDGTVRVVRSVRDLPVHPDEVAVIAGVDNEYAVLMGTPCAVIIDGDAGDAWRFESTSPPAVFLAGATHWLQTGMRVRVDGTVGVVAVMVDSSVEELIVVR